MCGVKGTFLHGPAVVEAPGHLHVAQCQGDFALWVRSGQDVHCHRENIQPNQVGTAGKNIYKNIKTRHLKINTNK